MTKKVFISHASEDKDRFVLSFATKLREKGIDAWLDKWEMLPGDNLIDKIFEEGLKEAEAIIIVLSENSVNKPWVKEELDAAMVKRIKRQARIIPVIIDECEVPECLKSTLWEKIEDLNHYDSEFSRIVMSIYGETDKPPLGDPPVYVQTVIDIIPGLTKIDTLVFKLICERAIGMEYPYQLVSEHIVGQAENFGIKPEDFRESLEILHHRSYIDAKPIENHILFFTITVTGFERYAKIFIKDYDAIIKDIALQIVNHNNIQNIEIAGTLKQPQMFVDYMLDALVYRGFIKTAKACGLIRITKVSPELKRVLRQA